MANRCKFDTLRPGEVLRDRILFGINDSHVRQHLLHEDKLTLTKTLEMSDSRFSATQRDDILDEHQSKRSSTSYGVHV